MSTARLIYTLVESVSLASSFLILLYGIFKAGTGGAFAAYGHDQRPFLSAGQGMRISSP